MWELAYEESDALYLLDIPFRMLVFVGSHIVYTGSFRRTSGVIEETSLRCLRDPFSTSDNAEFREYRSSGIFNTNVRINVNFIPVT